MDVVVTGATGFIGRAVVAALRDRGDRVVALVRDPARGAGALGPGVECVAWDAGRADGAWRARVAAADAVVHLAGEPVAARRWTDAVKTAIRDSRVVGTRHVVDAIATAAPRPRVLVNASAVGFYGATGDVAVDETAGAGRGFLADVTAAWEREARRARDHGVRVVLLRTGVVLGDAGGALERLVLPFKFFVGGPVGGPQWLPWVHLDDVVGVVLRALDDDALAGPVNVVAPNPVRMSDFARALGRALGRPSWLRVPGFAVKAAMGEMGGVVTDSVRVRPAALERAGYAFRYPDVEPALRAAVTPQGRADVVAR